MALILSGTNGLSDVDGTAATPAIRGTDTNTGMFFPAADTIAFSEGGVEAMRLDSAGNVGIGTSSPTTKLDVNGIATLRAFGGEGGEIDFNNPDNASVGLHVDVGASDTGRIFQIRNNSVLQIGQLVGTGGIVNFFTAANERARIDSSGNLLVGTTDPSFTASPGIKFRPSANSADMNIVQNTASNLGSYHLYNTNATNNGYRFYVTTNGGIANFSGNNVNLSDERTKKNIEVSGGYLNKICAIPVKLFNYKDEAEGTQRTLGVIAQDVEAVAPELVNSTDGWQGTEPEDGEPLKTIYTTDMMFAMMKAIQEQQKIIESLTARVAQLEAK